MRCGKIPNVLILSGIFIGVIQIIWRENILLSLQQIPAMIIPILFLYPIFKIGGIGAGDIKLLSLVCLYLPLTQSISCIFISLALGAILSLIKMAYYKNFKERMIYFLDYLKDLYLSGNFQYYHRNLKEERAIPHKSTQVHLGGVIFIGTLLAGGVFK